MDDSIGLNELHYLPFLLPQCLLFLVILISINFFLVLAQHEDKYFEQEEFVAYLKYLTYFHKPEYVKYITYPTCLLCLSQLLLRPFPDIHIAYIFSILYKTSTSENRSRIQ